MTTATSQRQPELTRQTVIAISGGAGNGLETTSRTAAEGAGIIVAGSPERAVAGLPEQTRHVMITAVLPSVEPGWLP